PAAVTVRDHFSSSISKLGVSCRVATVRSASDNGWLLADFWLCADFEHGFTEDAYPATVRTFESLLGLLIDISVPAFAIASMLSMGLRTPLRTFAAQMRDRRTVFSVLGANFVVIPAVGTLLVWLLNGLLPPHVGAGFIIALCAAGAPFVLQLGSVVFMPLVVPFLLQDVHVDGWAVARLLLGTMLAPMIAGIVLSAVFPDHADDLARTAGTVAAISAVLMFLSGFGSNSAF